MFPMAILFEGSTSLSFIEKVEDLPQGKPFRIILTKVEGKDFYLADKVAKRILGHEN